MAVTERTDSDVEEIADEEMSAQDIDATFVPSPRPEVTGVEVDGEAVLTIEGKWNIHWLNQISTVVWESLDGATSVEQLSAELSRTFGADPETVSKDVLDAVRQFGRAGFLEGVAEAAPSRGGVEGLNPGDDVPAFELDDLEGRTFTLENFRGEQLLLVNWSPNCGFCRSIASELAELQPDLRDKGIRPVFIAIGGPERNREFMDEFGLDVTLLLQESHEAEVFFGMGTPVAYMVDEEGKTASEVAYGADEVPKLARTAAGRPAESGDNGDAHTHQH